MERQFEYAHSHQLMAGDRSDAMRYLTVEIALPHNTVGMPVHGSRTTSNSIIAEVVLSSGGLDLGWRGLSQQLFIAQSPADEVIDQVPVGPLMASTRLRSKCSSETRVRAVTQHVSAWSR